jgi:hypothetical protein
MSEQGEFDKSIQWLADGIVAYVAERPGGVTDSELKDAFVEKVLDQRAVASGVELIEAMRKSASVDQTADLVNIAANFSVMLASTYVGLAIERLVQAKKMRLVRLLEGETVTYTGHDPNPYTLDVTVREVYRPTYEQWLEHVS